MLIIKDFQNPSFENTKKILNNIKQALFLNEDETTQSSTLEISKVSSDSTLTDSSSSSKENNKLNEYLNSFDYFQFEQNFKKYYVDSSQNNNGNYDNYVKNALKLISLIPFRKLYINDKIRDISKKINFDNYDFDENKKLLILDLDETLVHSDIDFLLKEKNINYDTILYFDTEEEKNIPLPLIIRPGLYEFLDYASQNFNLIIFTASDQQYADTIINYIEKDKKYFKMRLYRDNCIFIDPGLYIKDLRIIKDYDPMNVILMDNSLYSFMNQPSNGMLVNSFYTNHKDTQLISAKNFLINHIFPCDDIRKECEKWYHFTNLFYKGTSKEKKDN